MIYKNFLFWGTFVIASAAAVILAVTFFTLSIGLALVCCITVFAIGISGASITRYDKMERLCGSEYKFSGEDYIILSNGKDKECRYWLLRPVRQVWSARRQPGLYFSLADGLVLIKDPGYVLVTDVTERTIFLYEPIAVWDDESERMLVKQQIRNTGQRVLCKKTHFMYLVWGNDTGHRESGKVKISNMTCHPCYTGKLSESDFDCFDVSELKPSEVMSR